MGILVNSRCPQITQQQVSKAKTFRVLNSTHFDRLDGSGIGDNEFVFSDKKLSEGDRIAEGFAMMSLSGDGEEG